MLERIANFNPAAWTNATCPALHNATTNLGINVKDILLTQKMGPPSSFVENHNFSVILALGSMFFMYFIFPKCLGHINKK